jgi:hypothetical protein
MKAANPLASQAMRFPLDGTYQVWRQIKSSLVIIVKFKEQ